MFGIYIKSVPDCSTCLEMEYRDCRLYSDLYNVIVF